jgi:triosephosphate isomerase
MRRPIIAANWKMNCTISQARELVFSLKESMAGVSGVDVVLAPPFTALSTVAQLLAGTDIGLAAQDMYWEESGAYTGEVSPVMLKDVGCSHVIIGHSERRAYFSETDETVNKKIKAALHYGIIPIVCVGESLAQREAGQTTQVVGSQLQNGLTELTPEQMSQIVVAYEPIWAIGTGRTATPEQANEVHSFIREHLAKAFNQATAVAVRIQYGGSVKPDNVDGLMAQPDIDGALVGGASLKAESFAGIVKFKP